MRKGGNMEEADQETVADISTKTWDIMKYSLEKEGYREGVSSGKESVVQSSFDSGYSEGFKLAYAKGIVLGFLTVLENEKLADVFKVSEVENEFHNDRCNICNSVNPEILNGDVKGALKYIQDTSEVEINSLRDKYGQLFRSMKQDPDVIFK